MNSDDRAWLAELRRNAGLPSAGTDPSQQELVGRAARCFERVLLVQPDSQWFDGDVVRFQKGSFRFSYNAAEDALLFTPYDRDGNPFGAPVKLKDAGHAVSVLEPRLDITV